MSTNTGREFVLFDVDDRSDVELNIALDATVQYMSIEYLRQEEAEKPHVVFNFTCINYLELITTNNQQSKGCRVSMDWTGEDDKGELKIKTRSYLGSSRLATSALSFPVIDQTITLREIIDIFRGRHPLNSQFATYLDADQNLQVHYLADLTDFYFVQPDPRSQALDGCRDFMYALPTPIERIRRFGPAKTDGTRVHQLNAIATANQSTTSPGLICIPYTNIPDTYTPSTHSPNTHTPIHLHT